MRAILQSARVLLAVLTVLVPPGIEAATILLDDGGVHTLSGPSDPVAVANGTTLILQDGAVITGGDPSVSIDLTSSVTATGGSIAGATGANALSSAGTTTISGGTFQGGGGTFGGDGASISGPATISGGTFQGGDGRIGDGAVISGPATISGGTFRGGSSSSVSGDGASISGPTTISGGTFQGGAGASIVVSGTPVISVQGGLFVGPINLRPSSGEVDFFGILTFTGSRLTGVLADGTPLDQPVSLGSDIAVLSSPGAVRFLGPSAIPAPPALVLLGTGMIGTLGASWLRRGRARVAGEG